MSDEPEALLTGAEFELQSAGYRPMPDPEERPDREEIESDATSLREAAERRADSRSPVMVREYVDDSGNVVDPSEAVTLERAARDHARIRAAETDEAKAEIVRPGEGDELSGVLTDPTDRDEAERVAEPTRADEQDADRLAPELERALKHPQVLQAIEEKIGEAEAARQSYRDGLASAVQIAQASFLSQFPEFAGMPAEQIPAALAQMSREDPGRFERVQTAVARSDQLLAQQAEEQRRQAELAQRSFQSFAQEQDSQLEAMLSREPRATRQAVAAEIVTAAKENGISPAELKRLFETEPLMRHASFQRMMYDAARYRLMIRAKDAVVTKAVPPVIRPGVSVSSGERARSDLRALNARLSSSGDLKDAVALYQARRSGRP
ncbi:hypothetical protein SSBR45G_23920 [Bradyrhizobium sp. SSBR45G]|uniref:hypothetical protein n=1 Tax=unclassified Bradyrhizobium TaxID=2631580 RepID=UPI002342B76A|nr:MULTISPECIES: hypothetical protein [unclassified Bradyrhizobium]GLH77484.1 hypothetical protein SSBR45G_23920 [Bradyrhizobium sp. SSBR45G]GLH84410.1 hypothetical protein SSBR45R_18700 [Bradyrhizobium sp. SSBR45R]